MLYTNSDCLSQTKLVEISNYCDQNNLDIIAITEILPKFLFRPDEKNYSLDGYDLFISNLSRGRGCAIYLKDYLAATKVSFKCNFNDSVWCQIKLKNNDKLVIGCVYRSPNSTMENNQNLYQLLNIVNNSQFFHTY